jgi:hypothetical protein
MTRRKKWAVAVAVVGIGAVLAVFAAGAGDAESPRYWRRHAQSVLLRGAEWLPAGELLRAPAVGLTKASLRVLPRDVSGDELERAAGLLARRGEPATAATLWLGLSNLHFRNGDVNSSRARALRALRASRTEAALVSLVVLARSDPAQEARWIGELRDRAPGHELVVAAGCRDAILTFTADPPAICGAVGWVGEHARHGRREDRRIAREISELPARAAREVSAHEARIEGLSTEQLDLVRSYQALERELSGLGWRAAGEVLWDLSPFPREDDTLERYATREGVCRLPIVVWICGAAAVGEAKERMDERKAGIHARMAGLDRLYGLNESLIGISRERIAHWGSARPLEMLREERAGLIGRFRADLAEEAQRRYPEPGISVAAALDAVLARPDARRREHR